MSLFSGLYVGASGLNTSQDAINTTAHNLSNLNTVGYTRQQVEIDDRSYTTLSVNYKAISAAQIGYGSYYSLAKQVRDVFLDSTYRREVGREQYYTVAQQTYEEVEDLLGELQGEAFQTDLNNVWTSVQELAKDPSNTVYQTMFVQYCEAFLESANTIYEGFNNYQVNLNENIKKDVDKLNEYGARIAELNNIIRKIETGGVEHANDYRDERNLLLDEMSKLTAFDYKEDPWGNVNILIEGESFVNKDTAYKIDTYKNPETGFYELYWPHSARTFTNADGTTRVDISGSKVYNLTREIDPILNNDVGEIKSSLMARGDHIANYTDLHNENYGQVKKSALMSVEAEFDELVHNVVSSINDVLREAAGMKTGDLFGTGEEVRYFEEDSQGYMRMATGEPVQIFTLRNSEAYTKVNVGGKDYWVVNEENPEELISLYSIDNLEINSYLLQKPSLMGFIKGDGSVDYDTTEKLKSIFTEEVYTLNPDVATRHTIMSHYNALVSRVSNQAYSCNSMRESQESTLRSIEDAREEVLGVSSDDELTNLIKYQNAYNASSRYISTVSDMLEHLIMSLAG